ncbi:cytochrome P450 [Rhexocercosporidium sp. MPI-PUGE-AT-0058]|nr:cytochrome P450 [Rhexocercosporidium sp. MPI-PUGE-AT-0058]
MSTATFWTLGLPLILIYIVLRNSGSYFVDSSVALTGGAFYLCFLLILVVFKLYVYPFYISPLRHLPEPKGAGWLWAHASQIRKNHNGAPYRRWISEVPNRGLIRFRVLFNQERIFLTSTEALREVLVTNSYDFIKPEQASFTFRKILGDGVLVANGATHKRQRKILMPAFAFRHVKDLYPVFWDKATKSTDVIAAALHKPDIPGEKPSNVQNTYDWASRVTLDIIGVAGMGFEFNATENPHGDLYAAYHALFTTEPPLFRWINIGITISFKYVFPLIKRVFPNLKGSITRIRGVAYDLIRNKRSLAEKGKHMGVDILSVAMESGDLTDDELASQIMTFLAAGHETTASALTWTTYLLCTHPEIQKRLREEIRTKLCVDGVLKSSVDALEIDHLPYLNAVCNEVLRIMPSVPMTIRVPTHDTTILGQPVPKDTPIIVAAWAVNASKDFWGEDAHEFNPNRWLGEGNAKSGGAINNFANLTFLHGPRSCIGKDFARSELLCLVAAWFGRFEVELEHPGLEKDMIGWVTLRPQHGLPVKYKEIVG